MSHRRFHPAVVIIPCYHSKALSVHLLRMTGSCHPLERKSVYKAGRRYDLPAESNIPLSLLRSTATVDAMLALRQLVHLAVLVTAVT